MNNDQNGQLTDFIILQISSDFLMSVFKIFEFLLLPMVLIHQRRDSTVKEKVVKLGKA